MQQLGRAIHGDGTAETSWWLCGQTPRGLRNPRPPSTVASSEQEDVLWHETEEARNGTSAIKLKMSPVRPPVIPMGQVNLSHPLYSRRWGHSSHLFFYLSRNNALTSWNTL